METRVSISVMRPACRRFSVPAAPRRLKTPTRSRLSFSRMFTDLRAVTPASPSVAPRLRARLRWVESAYSEVTKGAVSGGKTGACRLKCLISHQEFRRRNGNWSRRRKRDGLEWVRVLAGRHEPKCQAARPVIDALVAAEYPAATIVVDRDGAEGRIMESGDSTDCSRRLRCRTDVFLEVRQVCVRRD